MGRAFGRGQSGPSRQLVIPLADPVQAQRKPDALFRGLENDKRRGLGGAELAQQLVVHHDLRHAAIGQAPDKTSAADVLIVELQAQPGGQQHAERRHTRISLSPPCDQTLLR